MKRIFATTLLLGLVPFVLGAQPEPKFKSQTLDDGVEIGYGLGIGDVDGDGKPDILLADKNQFVWYRNPDWKRFVMSDGLTEKDNVCLAVRDINGDGRVEVAVGAQWNPGETTDATLSGSVHYLACPEDPTKLWEAVQLHHEPTVHRMRWIKVGDSYQLVVLPLHGRGNQNGEGQGAKVLAYRVPDDPAQGDWLYTEIDQSMHLTHNMDIIWDEGKEFLIIGGKEGAKVLGHWDGEWLESQEWVISDKGFGEIRYNDELVAGIQPLHGNVLALYAEDGTKTVLTDSLKQGHALALADLLDQGRDQVVVGWRNPNGNQEIGIKLFISSDEEWSSWQSVWIDHNGMACEDLKVADLNGDGKDEIIASGRSTHNLVVYWNHSQ